MPLRQITPHQVIECIDERPSVAARTWCSAPRPDRIRGHFHHRDTKMFVRLVDVAYNARILVTAKAQRRKVFHCSAPSTSLLLIVFVHRHRPNK
jgi:hypothetical protein